MSDGGDDITRVCYRWDTSLENLGRASDLASEDEIRRLQTDNERLRAVLATIAEGCGHTRCHAHPWIRMARKALEG